MELQKDQNKNLGQNRDFWSYKPRSKPGFRNLDQIQSTFFERLRDKYLKFTKVFRSFKMWVLFQNSDVNLCKTSRNFNPRYAVPKIYDAKQGFLFFLNPFFILFFLKYKNCMKSRGNVMLVGYLKVFITCCVYKQNIGVQ